MYTVTPVKPICFRPFTGAPCHSICNEGDCKDWKDLAIKIARIASTQRVKEMLSGNVLEVVLEDVMSVDMLIWVVLSNMFYFHPSLG